MRPKPVIQPPHKKNDYRSERGFLAITTRGLRDAMRDAARSGASGWCGADAITEQDFTALMGKGLTRFAYALGARDPLLLEGALDTIGQHHPDEIVWGEAAASASRPDPAEADVQRVELNVRSRLIVLKNSPRILPASAIAQDLQSI